jgi:hypothetical protein
VLIGILGFIPGITRHYGDLTFAGGDSRAKLLGSFQVSILHNLVHLLFGVAGWFLARPGTAHACTCSAAASSISVCGCSGF